MCSGKGRIENIQLVDVGEWSLSLSFLLCAAASAGLLLLAERSPAALYISVAALGAGMASIFASGFLWAEQRMTVTNKVNTKLSKQDLELNWIAEPEHFFHFTKSGVN